MKKNLILSLSAAAILSVSAFAHMHQDQSNMGNMPMNQQIKNTQMNNHMMDNNMMNQNMMGNNGMMNRNMMDNNMMNRGMMGNNMMHNNMMGNRGMMSGNMMGHGMMAHNMMPHSMILPKIMMLDLSDDQSEKINKILNSETKKLNDPLDAFSDSKFDKKKYLKTIQNNRDNMMEVHAEKISKIYSLLTRKQKEDLKKIIDVQKLMKNKNMNYMMRGMHN